MKPATAAMSAVGAPEASSAGTSFFSKRPEAAALRLCTSSPMCSACAISGFNSTGPSTFNPAWSTGAITVPIHLSRSITSGPLAPKRSTLPSPSFMLENEVLAPLALRTIHTGIDGLMMPDIGPTALWW